MVSGVVALVPEALDPGAVVEAVVEAEVVQVEAVGHLVVVYAAGSPLCLTLGHLLPVVPVLVAAALVSQLPERQASLLRLQLFVWCDMSVDRYRVPFWSVATCVCLFNTCESYASDESGIGLRVWLVSSGATRVVLLDQVDDIHDGNGCHR